MLARAIGRGDLRSPTVLHNLYNVPIAACTRSTISRDPADTIPRNLGGIVHLVAVAWCLL
jgi:hypothetical protein